jgi:hypothetical protein
VRLACALVVVAVLGQDRHDRAAAAIRFPAEEELKAWSGKGEVHRRLVAEFTDRAKFAAGLRTIEARLGVRREALDIEAAFEESDDRRPARAAGKDGKGRVLFNLGRLVELQRRTDEVEALRALGRKITWVVPPVSYGAIVTHELTHIVVGTHSERWFTEGLACWVPDDRSPLYAFAHRKGRVEAIDQPLGEEDAYARGLLFFLWMEQRWNGETVRRFVDRVLVRGEPPKEALFTVTGNTWARMVGEEQAWSAKAVEKLALPK